MKVVRIRTVEGCKVAIIGEPGRKWTPYSTIEFPVRLHRIKNSDVGRFTVDIQYPLKKACKSFLRVGRSHGITKGARKFLRGAMA